MMFDFENQLAIVTGGTRGIGRAVAESFLRSGARVICSYVANDERAEEFKSENAAYGKRLDVRKFDVSECHQVEEFYEYVEREYESIDILINNAGIRRDGIVGMMPVQDWKAVIDVNLTGTFFMTRFAVRNMIKRHYGRIITITSAVARIGFKGQANYAASKAGQIGMTLSLAKEVARYGITANCISPGFISTEFIGDLKDEQVETYKKMIAMNKFGTPEQIAYGVLFLASKEASYITGAILPVDGGI